MNSVIDQNCVLAQSNIANLLSRCSPEFVSAKHEDNKTNSDIVNALSSSFLAHVFPESRRSCVAWGPTVKLRHAHTKTGTKTLSFATS